MQERGEKMLKARRVMCNSIIRMIFVLLSRVFPTLSTCTSSMSQLNIQIQEPEQLDLWFSWLPEVSQFLSSVKRWSQY